MFNAKDSSATVSTNSFAIAKSLEAGSGSNNSFHNESKSKIVPISSVRPTSYCSANLLHLPRAMPLKLVPSARY